MREIMRNMNVLGIFSSLVLAWARQARGGTLNLIQPTDLSVWHEGSFVALKWQFGDAGKSSQQNFKLELVSEEVIDDNDSNAGVRIVVQDRVPGMGRLRWKVPPNCYVTVGHHKSRCFADENRRFFLRFSPVRKSQGGPEKSTVRPDVFPANGFMIRQRKLIVLEPFALRHEHDDLKHEVTFPFYSVGEILTAKWRIEGVGASSNITVSIYLVREGYKKALALNGRAWGATNITITKDIPTGDHYRLYFESSPLMDSISSADDNLLPLQLHAFSHAFRLQGAHLTILEPGSWQNYEIGEKLRISWELSKLFALEEGFVEFVLIRWKFRERSKGDILQNRRSTWDTDLSHDLNKYKILRTDPGRRFASWSIPLEKSFVSDYYCVVAYQSGIEVGESSPVYIHGFLAFFLDPIPPQVVYQQSLWPISGIQVNMADKVARFSFRNPGHLIQSVSILARKCWPKLYPSAHLLASNLSLSLFPNFVGTFPIFQELVELTSEEPICLEIVPEVSEKDKSLSTMLQFGHPLRSHFVGQSAPFQILPKGTHLTSYRFVASGSFQLWEVETLAKLPHLDAKADAKNDASRWDVGMLPVHSSFSDAVSLEVDWSGGRGKLTVPPQRSGLKFVALVYSESVENDDSKGTAIAGPFWVARSESWVDLPRNLSAFAVGNVVPLVWVEPHSSKNIKTRIAIRYVPRTGESSHIGDLHYLSEFHTSTDSTNETGLQPRSIPNKKATKNSLDGSFSLRVFHSAWHIPCLAKQGKYNIVEESILGDETKWSILSTILVTELRSGVTSPLPGDVWRQGGRATVSWVTDSEKFNSENRRRSSCGFHAVKTVGIRLENYATGESYELRNTTGNSGHAMVTLPPRIPEGNKFKIVIEGELSVSSSVDHKTIRKLKVESEFFVIASVAKDEAVASDATDETFRKITHPKLQNLVGSFDQTKLLEFQSNDPSPVLVNVGEAIVRTFHLVLGVLGFGFVFFLLLVLCFFRREVRFLLYSQTISVRPPSDLLRSSKKGKFDARVKSPLGKSSSQRVLNQQNSMSGFDSSGVNPRPFRRRIITQGGDF